MEKPVLPEVSPAEIEHEPQGEEHTFELLMLAAVFWGLMVLLVVVQYLRS